MKCGWHFVTDDDTSEPLGAATFLDVGGDVKGLQSPLRLCRPYFKGLLSDAELVDRVQYWTAQGCGVQLCNEANLPIEQFPGGPADYAALYYRIKAQAPTAKLYWQPPSPGFPGWQEWLNGAEEADGICLHCYGTLAEMQAIVVETVLRFPGKPIWIGEVNFGPAEGKYVDLEDWAVNHFKPFLDWCAASVPEVEAVTYFAWKWPTPDMPQGTPVDGAGTAIERVLREWRQVVTADYSSAIWRPSPNFGYPKGTQGRLGHKVVAIVDHITAGSYAAVDSWFRNGSSGASSHYVVAKDGSITQYVSEINAAWTSGIDFSKGYDGYKSELAIPWIADLWSSQTSPNLVTLNIEHEAIVGEGLTEPQYQASLDLHRALVARYELPVDRTRIVGHSAIDAVNRANDPGSSFPWDRLLADLKGAEPMDEATKAKLLDHLNTAWGFCDQADAANQDIIRLAGDIDQSVAAFRERLIAMKQELGLDG